MIDGDAVRKNSELTDAIKFKHRKMQDLQRKRWTLRVDFICSLCFGTLSVLCLVTIVFIERAIL